ncbi:MAG: exodeoxyribonuclease VII small subunit [Ezakiella sp.]|uniref:exodeoxyribonuclease VII small subunit n=1 Tax=Ezakiella sp. TaxID=1935205 RepID=UPI002A915291|nr:exodeoxyribonuclease VII small subunit [Ezakiella sp.]MDY6079423.1 exodeoxyribonuclease VII small subunit [Ezakiella sp.]
MAKEQNKDFSYEKSIERINELLDKMENDDISLSENMEYFKEAKSLIKLCNEYLSNMEKEFEVIVANDYKENELQDEDLDFNSDEF